MAAEREKQHENKRKTKERKKEEKQRTKMSTSTDSYGTQPISAFEIDDGGDDDDGAAVLENGAVVADSFLDNVHSLPTPADLSGKRETDDTPKDVGSGGNAGWYKVLGFTCLFMLGIVGLSVGLAFGLQEFDLTAYAPELKASTDADEEKKTKQDKQYEIDYNKKSENFIIREGQYKKNKNRAYALLWEYCARSMQNTIHM